MSASERAELQKPAAVRRAAERIFAAAERGELAHFSLHLERLPSVVQLVSELARRAYGDASCIPVHGRYRHFGVGGIDRVSQLDARLSSASADEQLASRSDLVITSVLLDAGSGPAWTYEASDGSGSYRRSEGLAVASYDWFVAGGMSRAPKEAPLRADASRLTALTEAELCGAFQVTPQNPLVGVPGRLHVLQQLGAAAERSSRFATASGSRPGGLAVWLKTEAAGKELPAERVLEAVLENLSSIWPGRETLDGVPLGDVWRHSRYGLVPLHKLSQWLSYSLFEPLAASGVRVTNQNALTGLAEYRNGGLFLDAGVLALKDPAAANQALQVGSELVIEWRALTIALLDRVADGLRREWRLDAEQLPIAKVLEAGTWAAGRTLAAERRPDAGPPLRIESDGTVF